MANHPPSDDPLVVVGQFAGPHGVRGDFKLRSFTENPAAVGRYGPLKTRSGQVLTIKLGREIKPGVFMARAPEIKSREDCDVFKGALLHVPRTMLPPADEDEYYLNDLEGMIAVTPDGEPAGTVKAVVNYGAGDIVELTGVPDRKGNVMVPFTKADVPVVDMEARQITVLLPEEDNNQLPDEEEFRD